MNRALEISEDFFSVASALEQNVCVFWFTLVPFVIAHHASLFLSPTDNEAQSQMSRAKTL